MRFVISFLLALSTVSLHAQDCNPVFFGKHYTYLRVFIVPENGLETLFWVVTDKDSVSLDLSDKAAFIKSVLSSNETFVVYSPQGLKLAYGEKENYESRRLDYHKFDYYRRELFRQMDADEKTAEFTLLTGETVFVDYADIKGMFVRVGGECDRKERLTSGLPKELMSETTVMLVGMIGCYPTSGKFKLIANEGK